MNSHNNLIELSPTPRRPHRPAGELDTLIRQEDLEELLLLKRRAQETLLELKRKNDRLLWMTLRGIPIEPGVHTTRAVLVRSRACNQLGRGHYRLVVR